MRAECTTRTTVLTQESLSHHPARRGDHGCQSRPAALFRSEAWSWSSWLWLAAVELAAVAARSVCPATEAVLGMAGGPRSQRFLRGETPPIYQKFPSQHIPCRAAPVPPPTSSRPMGGGHNQTVLITERGISLKRARVRATSLTLICCWDKH